MGSAVSDEYFPSQTDDKEALMSSYQRFHADEGGGEGSKEGKLAKTKTKKKKGKQEEEEYG